MEYNAWYSNLPFYKKINMQNEFNFDNWNALSESQKVNIYHAMFTELYIDGPVEFYREEKWTE